MSELELVEAERDRLKAELENLSSSVGKDHQEVARLREELEKVKEQYEGWMKISSERADKYDKLRSLAETAMEDIKKCGSHSRPHPRAGRE